VVVFLQDALAAYFSIAALALAIALIVIARIDIENSIRGEAAAGGDPEYGFDPTVVTDMIQVEWKAGFYLAIGALLAAIAMAILMLKQERARN